MTSIFHILCCGHSSLLMDKLDLLVSAISKVLILVIIVLTYHNLIIILVS